MIQKQALYTKSLSGRIIYIAPLDQGSFLEENIIILEADFRAEQLYMV